MKNTLIVPLFAMLLLASSCGKRNAADTAAAGSKAPEPVVNAQTVAVGNETALFLNDLKENGDYVNSTNFPSLIKAAIVYENIGKNQLVIDIRSDADFRAGHIKGAVNKKPADIPAYFVSGIKPFEYDRIILVCPDGQLSGYYTCLLRLMGYGNVYAMRWGMSAWNKSLAEKGWLAGMSGKFEDRLETAVHEKSQGSSLPELKTGFGTAAEIAEARFSALFAEDPSLVQVTAGEVFSDPSRFYIINLERKDKYEDGHIPGAVRYKPESTLGFTDEMASIPAGKPVVVYCGTGHNSAFATAYLRLFGYDARTLKYGNNSFMHNRMLSKRESLSWLPFSLADVNDFETVK